MMVVIVFVGFVFLVFSIGFGTWCVFSDVCGISVLGKENN